MCIKLQIIEHNFTSTPQTKPLILSSLKRICTLTPSHHCGHLAIVAAIDDKRWHWRDNYLLHGPSPIWRGDAIFRDNPIKFHVSSAQVSFVFALIYLGLYTKLNYTVLIL